MSTSAPLRRRHSRERASWPVRARRIERVPAWVLAVGSALVVLGGVGGLDPVMTAGGGVGSNKINGALAFLGLAVGLLLPAGSRGRRIAYAVALAIGAATLLEYLSGLDLGIDQLFGKDTHATGHFPGRPAQSTTLGVTLLGLSGLLTEVRRGTMAQVTAGVALLIGMTGTFGYLYGVDELHWTDTAPAMSASGALALLIAALLLWLDVPQGAMQWVGFGTDSGARSQRVLVPVALVLIPAATWLYVEGLKGGLYGTPFGSALITTFVSLIIVVFGYFTGRTAFRMDLERDTLLDEVHRVNVELEDRVRAKVHQLNRQKTKLALFEERDRIARDLHDRVIQRIFAAGLQTASLGRSVRKATAQGFDSSIAAGLDQVAVELDMAIRELRNSIFELTSIGDDDNLEQVVREIAARAARILGFMPRIDVQGEIASINADLVVQIASVIQEGLSNVARHAHASGVSVTVTATAHDLRVRITDDGDGLPDPLPRSSGISNLTNRARQLGGTATWANGDPKGTVLTWRVPRSGQPVEEPHGYETPVAASESAHSAEAVLSS